MITKIRQIIAYQVSIFLMLISFGLLIPDYSEKFAASAPVFKNKSEISLSVDEDLNKKDT